MSHPLTFWRWLFLSAALLAVPFARAGSLAGPPAGKLYHGVYPGGMSGEEDDLTPADVQTYEILSGQRVAWVYFSHNWYRSRAFPLQTAVWIRSRGAVPYLRLMLRSSAEPADRRRERTFTLDHLLAGQFDEDLRAWGRAARDFGTPLIVEYGTECNGRWFPWNAVWNGGLRRTGYGDPRRWNGPEKFVAAYRRIVTLVRGQGASNITWVFHADATDDPDREFNRMELYYPGDDVVDWVALSAYGAQTPMEDSFEPFRDQIDAAYPRLQRIAPGKPVIIAEFGCTGGNPLVQPQDWAGRALDDLLGNRWPAVIGFSWWNERWENNDRPAEDTTMRLQDLPALADTFRQKFLAVPGRLQTEPMLRP